MENHIVLIIRTVHPHKVIDAVNETLRELATDGTVDDYNDEGWAWKA